MQPLLTSGFAPTSACPGSWGEVALPLPGLEVVVSGSSTQTCPRRFGCLSPSCPALAGSSGLLQQLRSWKKTGGKHPVHKRRANPRCDGASHQHPLLAKPAGSDGTWQDGGLGVCVCCGLAGRGDPQLLERQAGDAGLREQGVKPGAGCVWSCELLCLAELPSKGGEDGEGCRVQLYGASLWARTYLPCAATAQPKSRSLGTPSCPRGVSWQWCVLVGLCACLVRGTRAAGRGDC